MDKHSDFFRRHHREYAINHEARRAKKEAVKAEATEAPEPDWTAVLAAKTAAAAARGASR